MGKDYINKHEYHTEMVKCKKAGKLSTKVIEMFTLHATEVSRGYWFRDEEERKDAIASAIHDFASYWKNFKESNVVQLKLVRNFRIGETITLDIDNFGEVTYIAGKETNPDENIFKIGDTTNHSLQTLHNLVKEKLVGVVEPSLHKVTMKIAFMDVMNEDDLIIKSKARVGVKNVGKDEHPDLIFMNTKKIKKMLKSLDLVEHNKKQIEKCLTKLEIYKQEHKNSKPEDCDDIISKIMSLVGTEILEQMMDFIGKPLTRLDKVCVDDVYSHEFTNPPNAFNFFTSYCHNGILKGINKTSPKQTRNGVLINLGSVNNDSNGMYNL